MSRVTVGVASLRTLTAQWPYVPIIDQNLQHFTGDGDVFKWVIDSWVGQKIPNKQNIQTNWLFLLFENAVEICLLSFFTKLTFNIFINDTLVFLLSSLSEYTLWFIAMLNNCLMHDEFPFDAWLKINAWEKTFFKGKKNVFPTNVFDNHD